MQIGGRFCAYRRWRRSGRRLLGQHDAQQVLGLQREAHAGGHRTQRIGGGSIVGLRIEHLTARVLQRTVGVAVGQLPQLLQQ